MALETLIALTHLAPGRCGGNFDCMILKHISLTDILIISWWTALKSSPPSAAYMRQWTGSTLVQIMASCLFGAKPLSKPMLQYCYLDTNFSEILIEIITFSFKKMHLKVLSAKHWPFCHGFNVLIKSPGPYWWWVNIGLMLGGKPLPKQKLTQISVAI